MNGERGHKESDPIEKFTTNNKNNAKKYRKLCADMKNSSYP